MSLEPLAKKVAESLARHQSRGLVDDAKGMRDVIIHGHVDLVGVASDVLTASIAVLKPARKSWGGWFVLRADARRRLLRNERELERLAEKLENASNDAEAAIIRLKSREISC